MPRLFVAIQPPTAIREELAKRQTGLDGARWVPVEQLHVTLRFLGSVPENEAQDLARTLAEIRAPAFDLAVSRAGSFGHPPRVIWAGVEPGGPVGALAAQVEAAVQRSAPSAEEPPRRRDVWHLTLARLKRTAPFKVRSYLAEQASLALGPWPVASFILFESQLSQTGAIHTKRATFPLGSHEGNRYREEEEG